MSLNEIADRYIDEFEKTLPFEQIKQDREKARNYAEIDVRVGRFPDFETAYKHWKQIIHWHEYGRMECGSWPKDE